MRFFFIVLTSFLHFSAFGQADSTFLKVHFLYGSKPLKVHRPTEKKWFGGILGGHVGLESTPNRILNFEPKGRFHWFPHRKNKHGGYTERPYNRFYGYFENNPDSTKKTIIDVPISALQKRQFDSLSAAYLAASPYDYALFGMRCGSASYDILGQLNILPKYSYTKRLFKVMYPKKLRKRLLKKAANKGWRVEKVNGSFSRKWEKD